MYIHKELQNPKWRYFMKFDIKKYYENINIDILYKQINKLINDKKFIELTKQLLSNYKNGLPIGSIVSQYLALFYLINFINDLKVECKKYNTKLICNYVDDFLILGTNKRKLIKLLDYIQNKLKDLKLSTNKKTIIYSTKDRKVSMLGYRLINRRIMLRKAILKNLYRIKDKNKYKSWLMWLIVIN